MLLAVNQTLSHVFSTAAAGLRVAAAIRPSLLLLLLHAADADAVPPVGLGEQAAASATTHRPESAQARASTSR